MKGWKLTGLAATIIIILSVPLYLLKISVLSPLPVSNPQGADYSFVGGRKCADCHRKEYDNWQGSYHNHAMGIASKKNVLGDFNNAMFTSHGVTSRFYKKDDKFYVHTGENDKRIF